MKLDKQGESPECWLGRAAEHVQLHMQSSSSTITGLSTPYNEND